MVVIGATSFVAFARRAGGQVHNHLGPLVSINVLVVCIGGEFPVALDRLAPIDQVVSRSRRFDDGQPGDQAGGELLDLFYNTARTRRRLSMSISSLLPLTAP